MLVSFLGWEAGNTVKLRETPKDLDTKRSIGNDSVAELITLGMVKVQRYEPK